MLVLDFSPYRADGCPWRTGGRDVSKSVFPRRTCNYGGSTLTLGVNDASWPGSQLSGMHLEPVDVNQALSDLHPRLQTSRSFCLAQKRDRAIYACLIIADRWRELIRPHT